VSREEDVRSALDAVVRAHEQATALITAVEDADEAFRLATELRDTVDLLVGKAAGLRATMARRIYEREQLSLSGLAQRLGVSKSRADQFLQTARRPTEGMDDA
jgi:hypothetical protein